MKKVILFFTVFIIIFLNIYPNFHAKFNTPKDKVFLGQASWFDPWDINLYVSVIHSGQANGILLQNNYTTVSNKPIVMYPLYTILGSIFDKTNPFFIFHSAATLTGIIFAFCIFYFLKFFLNNFLEKIFALSAICLGGGFGFLIYPQIQSADLAMTSLMLTSVFQRPHEAIGTLAYLAALIFFYLSIYSQRLEKRKFTIIGAFALLVAAIFYPYFLLGFCLISFATIFVANRGTLNFNHYKILLVFLAPSLVPAYLIYGQLAQNSTFSEILSPDISTPNIVLILLGYGILVPFFIYQLFFVQKNKGTLFLNLWVIISLLLAYLPLGFARFFLRGLYLPLVILSIVAIVNISKKLNVNKVIALTIFTTILLLSTFRMTYSRLTASETDTPWYYVSKNEHNALEFLKNNSKNRAGVAALYKFGNIIPAHTNNTVYFGHLFQTPNAYGKLDNLYALYLYRMTPAQAQNFLQDSDISFVLWGKDEKKLSRQFKNIINFNDYYTFLKPVFRTNDLTIFATIK